MALSRRQRKIRKKRISILKKKEKTGKAAPPRDYVAGKNVKIVAQ